MGKIIVAIIAVFIIGASCGLCDCECSSSGCSGGCNEPACAVRCREQKYNKDMYNKYKLELELNFSDKAKDRVKIEGVVYDWENMDESKEYFNFRYVNGTSLYKKCLQEGLKGFTNIEGKAFLGFYDTKDSSGTCYIESDFGWDWNAYNKLENMVLGGGHELKLYAVWEPIKFDVKFKVEEEKTDTQTDLNGYVVKSPQWGANLLDYVNLPSGLPRLETNSDDYYFSSWSVVGSNSRYNAFQKSVPINLDFLPSQYVYELEGVKYATKSNIGELVFTSNFYHYTRKVEFNFREYNEKGEFKTVTENVRVSSETPWTYIEYTTRYQEYKDEILGWSTSPTSNVAFTGKVGKSDTVLKLYAVMRPSKTITLDYRDGNSITFKIYEDNTFSVENVDLTPENLYSWWKTSDMSAQGQGIQITYDNVTHNERYYARYIKDAIN